MAVWTGQSFKDCFLLSYTQTEPGAERKLLSVIKRSLGYVYLVAKERGAAKQEKSSLYLKFSHFPKYKREDQFFENPQAAQGNHVPVSMGIIFEILSTERESAVEKAWKFSGGKNRL